MAKKATFGWQKAPVSTLKLQLDALNPRIDVPNSASQEQIRVALIESERVVDLAKAIVRTNGVMAGERIIVTTEDNRFIVLEGNRRVCACQILIKPELAPAEYRDSFPAPTQALKDTISDVDTDIAPSRDAAEPIITRRHTEPGIEPWTPIANQRRLLRLLATGKTLSEICTATGMTPARAQRLLQDARLMQYVLSLSAWSKKERGLLVSPDLKPNAFIRFFSLKGVKDTLKMTFDAEGLELPRFGGRRGACG